MHAYKWVETTRSRYSIGRNTDKATASVTERYRHTETDKSAAVDSLTRTPTPKRVASFSVRLSESVYSLASLVMSGCRGLWK